MKPKSIFFLITLFLLTLLHPHPTTAHNGAVAIAVPIEGIMVDGDLSDWPEGTREYPIERYEYGFSPQDSADFQGSFRIGFNEKEKALYVAVEVRDESVIIDETAGSEWDSKDGCELYVDMGHEKEDVSVIQQYVILGNNRSASSGERMWGNVKVEVQRSIYSHRYEWWIDIGAIHTGKNDPILERLVGLDVVVCDKDEEGSFSWMSWGHGLNKVESSDRIGFVLLGGKDIGTIKGTIKWEDMEEGMKLGKVHIQSLIFDELWVHLQPNQEGTYEAELPVGKYQIKAGYHGMSETLEVEVKKGHEVTVGELFFKKPAMVIGKPAMAIGIIDYYGLRKDR
jgi:hypothetical protein